MKTLIAFKDIIVTASADTLVIENSRLRREFDLSSGAPRTRSLRLSDGTEFSAPDKAQPDLAFIGMHPAGASESIPWKITDIFARVENASFLDAEHVIVVLAMREEVSETEYFREYILYPGFPALSVRNSIRPKVLPMLHWTRRGGLDQLAYRPDIRESIADSLLPAPGFVPVKTVSFVGRTDVNDDLVLEHKIEGESLNGNLLFCENARGAGFLYLQEAPPSGERRDLEEADFTVRDGVIASCCWGIHPSEIRPGETYCGYRHDLLLYRTDAERDLLLKLFLKKRFARKPYSVMVNPWGCGRFPSLVNEEFLIREVEAAAEVGATHYQIDDAWQEGGALSEIMVKNRHVTPKFWEVSKARLGGTLAKVTGAASRAGVEPSLWMAPSSNCEYRDWKSFAERVLELHREYGLLAFKIDAVLIRTHEAEKNLRNLLEYVRRETNGKVYFNLDTTSGQRPGYFLFLEYGNIFLENRYVCHTWGLGYHPEKTLRSLWKLSRYMRPQELQIEVPYAGDIRREFYESKPWCQPDTYPQDYWAAIALFANPLLWFAPSTVRPEDRAPIRKMMELHRKIRGDVFAGEIGPVGAEPDGKAFTGLHSRSEETDKDFVVLYREAGAEENSALIELPRTRNTAWKVLGGEGHVSGEGPGQIRVSIPRASWLLLES